MLGSLKRFDVVVSGVFECQVSESAPLRWRLALLRSLWPLRVP